MYELFSPPARIAAPGRGDPSLDELRMCSANDGMPLEMLAGDVTPVGLHYLLVHYYIPILDAHQLGGWRSAATSSGRCSTSRRFSSGRPSRTGCATGGAGNGRLA